jgi:hypothetical protein
LLRVAGGYVAFARDDAAGATQVFVRLPTGEDRRVSVLATSSYVEALAPTGQVTFVSGGRRYLGGPGAPARDIGGAPDGVGSWSLWQDGRWLVVDGAVVYAVPDGPPAPTATVTPTATTTPTPSPSPPPGGAVRVAAATASSEAPGHPAPLAVDGDPATAWRPCPGIAGSYL